MTEFIMRAMTPPDLSSYVARQLAAFFPDGNAPHGEGLQPHVNTALERTRACFSGIPKKKYRDGDNILFNYLHPDHYAAFLYLLANTVVRHDPQDPMGFKLYYLNKVLHGLDVYPDVELPEVFQFMHPVGTILGHARYGNHFCVYQGCSVGSGEDGVFPVIGDCVVLYAGASVIGCSQIGDNVVVGAGARIINGVVPQGKVVVARPNFVLRDNTKHVLERRFR